MIAMVRKAAGPMLLALAVVAGPASRPVVAVDTDSGEKVYKKTLRACVWILVPIGERVATPTGTRIRAMTGTGSLIDVKRALILTNYHVVGDRDEAMVYFPIIEKGQAIAERKAYQQGGHSIRARVVHRDTKRDLALLQLEHVPHGAQALSLAKESPVPGMRLHSIGNPGASDALWAYTSGTVRQVYHKTFQTGGRNGEKGFEVDARVVETQSPVNQGDSGGPVVNDRGELVAVTQGHLADSQARLFSIFIDVSEVKGLLASKGLRKVAPTVTAKETADKPHDVEAAADNPEAKEKEKEEAQAKMEKDAARKLKLARMLADDGLADKARVRYQEIIDTYPKTKAAAEARELLEKAKK
jgi:S1-C subfamily serine protease